MIAEIGHYAVALALMMSVVQGTFPLIGAHRNNAVLMGIAGPAARGQFLFVALAFCALTYAYVVSDFSVALVASTSHTHALRYNNAPSPIPCMDPPAAVRGVLQQSLLLTLQQILF